MTSIIGRLISVRDDAEKVIHEEAVALANQGSYSVCTSAVTLRTHPPLRFIRTTRSPLMSANAILTHHESFPAWVWAEIIFKLQQQAILFNIWMDKATNTVGQICSPTGYQLH